MIKTFDYLRSLDSIESEIMECIQNVLRSGFLILGPETEAFEQEFADFVGVKYCIGVNSGTTALHLALMGLGVGPGDEVITVANTCVPTISAIELCGAKPVFIDVREEDLMIDPDQIAQAITPRTRCLLPVHLWGQSLDLDRIRQIASQEHLLLVEDCAQAHGTRYQNQHVGTFGQAGCFSFYPTKNLGAYGDAGAIVTNDRALADRLRRMRMYGYDHRNQSLEPGMNARIAELQAAILRVKLRYLPQWLARRRQIATYYADHIANPQIRLPYRYADRDHAFHQYVIRCQARERVIAALQQQAIGFGIHYPVPVHKMPAYQRLQDSSSPLPVTEAASTEILSLPIHEALLDEEVEKIVSSVNSV
ncbi:aminotransferase class I/II-fold pyridoxal phosphate-dependent enzyme [candidate division KSB3 bacterium]|uniref:Aminotransferase class I/II-fold pyridoxal phosphate-dependent enzyme n=1 Tax=candidate division KSB3 bacterium TaxID=2044937 RepID=A0A9D5Q6C0_9BACT|nr:aminotransferase class I/II-fold pyridoxal phosphate-dependent enzyme [candidate division KSB3 bacterium]MBD3324766.1 aminotransferase class I/II-fold pyridoxal phosphate-dependent enzyme [candidate division KSB3 bacterium]